MEIFGSLPDWIQDKIKSNLEFNGSALQRALGGEPDDSDDNDDGGDDDWS